MLSERGGHTTDHRVGFPKARDIRRRIEPAGSHHVAHEIRTQMLEVIFTAMQRLDFDRVHIEAQDIKSRFMKSAQQRQADIAQADDAHAGRAGFDFGKQFCARVHPRRLQKMHGESENPIRQLLVRFAEVCNIVGRAEAG